MASPPPSELSYGRILLDAVDRARSAAGGALRIVLVAPAEAAASGALDACASAGPWIGLSARSIDSQIDAVAAAALQDTGWRLAPTDWLDDTLCAAIACCPPESIGASTLAHPRWRPVLTQAVRQLEWAGVTAEAVRTLPPEQVGDAPVAVLAHLLAAVLRRRDRERIAGPRRRIDAATEHRPPGLVWLGPPTTPEHAAIWARWSSHGGAIQVPAAGAGATSHEHAPTAEHGAAALVMTLAPHLALGAHGVALVAASPGCVAPLQDALRAAGLEAAGIGVISPSDAVGAHHRFLGVLGAGDGAALAELLPTGLTGTLRVASGAQPFDLPAEPDLSRWATLVHQVGVVPRPDDDAGLACAAARRAPLAHGLPPDLWLAPLPPLSAPERDGFVRRLERDAPSLHAVVRGLGPGALPACVAQADARGARGPAPFDVEAAHAALIVVRDAIEAACAAARHPAGEAVREALSAWSMLPAPDAVVAGLFEPEHLDDELDPLARSATELLPAWRSQWLARAERAIEARVVADLLPRLDDRALQAGRVSVRALGARIGRTLVGAVDPPQAIAALGAPPSPRRDVEHLAGPASADRGGAVRIPGLEDSATAAPERHRAVPFCAHLGETVVRDVFTLLFPVDEDRARWVVAAGSSRAAPTDPARLHACAASAIATARPSRVYEVHLLQGGDGVEPLVR